MRRALLIAIVLAAAPRLAAARCGYFVDDFCDYGAQPAPRGFGQSPIWVEGGVDALHFVPATTNQPMDVVGGQLRVLARNGGYHVGFEFVFADLSAVMPMTSARAVTGEGGMTVPTGGDVAQTKLLVGTRADLGPATFLGEVASGLQVAMYDNLDKPPSQMWLLLEVHAQANVWLTPRLTLGALASVDVVNPELAQLSLVVGYHLRDFDSSRR
ncbi:MAG TPA: hypothetical protein VMJ10_28590 [Kofleriaceae bacterium]|nr:hypothetical protein [Kofleriaceae bacterium]